MVNKELFYMYLPLICNLEEMFKKIFWLCDQDDAQICVSLCYKRWGRVPLVRASLCPSPACFEPSRPQYLAVRPPRHFPEVKAVLRILKQTPANRGKSHKQLNPIDSAGKGRTNCLTQEIQLSLVTNYFWSASTHPIQELVDDEDKICEADQSYPWINYLSWPQT